MKSVLIPIHPKWCELIANGKKTIDVRKTRPKIKTPFKCYIYCTKQGRPLVYGSPCPTYVEENLVQTYGYSKEKANEIFGCWNGKVIGEFVCDNIEVLFDTNGNPINYMKEIFPNILAKTQLLHDEFAAYVGSRAEKNNIYGWHISDLKIYDEPKELSEFRMPIEFHRGKQKENCQGCWDCEMKTSPKSWCYVESVIE